MLFYSVGLGRPPPPPPPPPRPPSSPQSAAWSPSSFCSMEGGWQIQRSIALPSYVCLWLDSNFYFRVSSGLICTNNTENMSKCASYHFTATVFSLWHITKSDCCATAEVAVCILAGWPKATTAVRRTSSLLVYTGSWILAVMADETAEGGERKKDVFLFIFHFRLFVFQ